MEKVTRENIAEHLLDYQLSIIGKTKLDTISDDKWRFNFTMTREQKKQFALYAIPLLQKVFRFNKSKANATLEFFNSQFGLRIKN